MTESTPTPDTKNVDPEQTASEILNHVNLTHSAKYTIDHQLPGGFAGGAYLVTSQTDNSPAVLKWNRDKTMANTVVRAATIVEEARLAHNWPTPRWLCSGISPSGYAYVVQEFVADASPLPRHVMIPNRLIDLALPFLEARHKGRAPKSAGVKDWSAYDMDIVFGRGEGGKQRETIRNASATGAEIIQLVKTWTEPWRESVLQSDDLVHGDYQTGNVLVKANEIVALVDVELVGKGSLFHDVAQLALVGIIWGCESGGFDRFINYAKRHAAPGEWEVCLAARLYPLLTFHVEVSQHIG